MTSLKLVVLGVLVVAIDLNVENVDLLLDPVGYLLVALGVHRLAHRHPGFRWARAAALVGLVASLFTAAFRAPAPEGGVLEPWLPSLVESLAQAGFAVAVCTALIAVSSNPRVTGPARTLLVALPAVDVLAALLSLGAYLTLREGTPVEGMAGLGAVLAASAVLLAVLAIALAVWFVVVLWRAAGEQVAPAAPRAAMIAG